jgi:hypothetical protein
MQLVALSAWLQGQRRTRELKFPECLPFCGCLFNGAHHTVSRTTLISEVKRRTRYLVAGSWIVKENAKHARGHRSCTRLLYTTHCHAAVPVESVLWFAWRIKRISNVASMITPTPSGCSTSTIASARREMHATCRDTSPAICLVSLS